LSAPDLGRAADLVGQRRAALAELGLERSESFQQRDRHLERIEHQNLVVLGLRVPRPSSPDASAERTSRDERAARPLAAGRLDRSPVGTPFALRR
jgi:hypothetical protein